MESSQKEKDMMNSQKTSADFMFEGLVLSIPDMLKAGVHFGHKKSRWNPKMKPYVFGIRNGISIIDLEKTQGKLAAALEFVKSIVGNGGKILLVGTKPQAKNLVEYIAKAVEMPYITHRWLGGTFTNFPEIRKRLKYLNDQEGRLARGELEKYTKYEQIQFKKEIEKMNEKMGGIKKLEGIPQALLVADIKENGLAVKEAKAMKVPVIAIVDTNVDPDPVDYPIPGNDDALSSLRYLLGMIAKAIKETKVEIKTKSSDETVAQKDKSDQKEKK